MGPYDIDMKNVSKEINDKINKRVEGNIKRYLIENEDVQNNIEEENIRLRIISDIMKYYDNKKDIFSSESQITKVILDIIKIINK